MESEKAAFDLPPGLLLAIEAREKRKIYDFLDLETLLTIAEENLDQAILDYIFLALNKSNERTRDTVSAMGEGFLNFYSVWLVEAEVMNGGFNQFFWNSSADFAEDVPKALRAIGAPRAAEIAQAALFVAIKEAQQRDGLRVQNDLQAFSDSYQHTDLGLFDEEFALEARRFADLRVAYVRRNQSLFVTPHI